MKLSLLFTLTLTLAFRVCNGELPAAADYRPPADSPLAKGLHPRLFVTRADLPQLKARILQYYRPDLQQFIAHMDALYTEHAGNGDLEDWNEIIGAARSFAFLYLFNPESVQGLQYAHKRADYGRKAIELALYLAQKLPTRWNETHHGAKNLSTDKGGLASLALQVVYDWTYDLSTVEERRRIADRLISLWHNRYDSDKVKLENHYATNVHVYAGALCFYADEELGSFYIDKANEMMRSFEDIFLQRQLAVAERIFEGSSDWVEGDSYALDGFTGIMLLAAAAGSAMGENYFATNPWLRNAPLYFYYNIMTMPYNGAYYFSQQNTSSVLETRDQITSAVMIMAANKLAESHPELASFAAWLTERSPYMIPFDAFKYNDPHLYDLFYKFLMGNRHVQPRSPDELKIPLSVHLGQMHAMRSDHSPAGATLIQFFSHMYWYDNGHNEEEQGAFNLHRFGTLAISAANSKNAGRDFPKVDKNGKGYALNNVLGVLGGDLELNPEMGKMRVDGDNDLPQYFEPGAPEHIGTVEAREYREGMYDYVNYNYTRSYKGDSRRVELARRILVYLRGPVNHEFVVVLDRVRSAHEKYFILHTPTEPVALDGSWQVVKQGHWKSQARSIKVVNRLDGAHGQMYLTSLWPEQMEMHRFGGPGYEWVWPDGTPLDYDPGRFNDRAAYLLSSYTLQIRSHADQFLTVMQIGDAFTIGEPAPVSKLQGPGWVGAFVGGERVVIFSADESPISRLSYRISGDRNIQHLITEVPKHSPFRVQKAGRIIAQGETGENGTIAFADHPGGETVYEIQIDQRNR